MSLASFAVRTCTIEALRGQTLAAGNIVDSPIDPIELADGASTATIAVFSDSERLTPPGRTFQQTRDERDDDGHTLDLTLQVYLPATPAVPTPGQPDLKLDALESGAAFVIDLIYRQMVRALTLLDGSWADLWRRAVTDMRTVEVSAYVMETDKGARVPARMITLRLGILDEPAFCGLADPFWGDFVAAMSASDDLVDLAPIVAAAVQGDSLPPWRGTAALLGLRPEDAVSISTGPLGGTMTDPVVPMAQLTVDGADGSAQDGALGITPTSDPVTK